MHRSTLIAFPLLLTFNLATGQTNLAKVSRIDSVIKRIDSIQRNGTNIGNFVVPRFSDSDTTRLYNHYILDTVKRHLYKCVYDCTFRGREEITFYFLQGAVIKVIVNLHEYNEQPFQGIYYFDQGTNIYKHEDPLNNKNLLWDVGRILAKSKEYLNDFPAISKVLDHAKK